MTAEVGVINRMGVALAADSAVTVSASKGKIYTSADKLFQLAANAPVAIMIYGAANFLGVPWETIIKIYRASLGNRRFSKIEQYADNFLLFLQNNKSMFPIQAQDQWVKSHIGSFYYFLLSMIKENIDKEIASKGKLNGKEVSKIIEKIIVERLQLTHKIPFSDGISETFRKALLSKYRGLFSKIRIQVFQKLPFNNKTIEVLQILSSEVIARKDSGGLHSGLVIAGFGEKEHFPLMIPLIIKGMSMNHLLYFKGNFKKVGVEVNATVIPFAQGEMVNAFMEGIDPDYKLLVENSTVNLFQGVCKEIFLKLKKECPTLNPSFQKDISKQVDKLLLNLLQKWEEERSEHYGDPVMAMVASLPKDELAAVAESLVNLTKFKRRVSNQPETVGGPIDVAVITKGDGFIWVKRKHYFQPELNPRYIAKCRSENL
jgi:hypothetical protein